MCGLIMGQCHRGPGMRDKEYIRELHNFIRHGGRDEGKEYGFHSGIQDSVF